MNEKVDYIRKSVDKIIHTEKINADDLCHVRVRQWFVEQFLATKKNDHEAAAAFLIECLKWRASFGVSDIHTIELNTALAENFIYFHGCDLNSCNIMWLNWSRYQFITLRRTAERLFVFWLEKHLMETQNTPFTLLINFHGCDEHDIDKEFSNFLKKCLTEYYPRSVSLMLLYQLPRSIHSFWAGLASCLSNNMAKFCVVNVDSISIKKFVAFKFLPQSMGGEDDYVFVMHRLPYCIYSRHPIYDCADKNDFAEDEFTKFKLMRRRKLASKIESASKKTVTFKSDLLNENDFVPLPYMSYGNFNVKPHFLEFCPKDELRLHRNDKSEYIAELVLKNCSGLSSQIFKVKTTAPQKFRVRPTLGLMQPAIQQTISIALEKDYEKSFRSERFLISTILANSFDANPETLQDFEILFFNAKVNETCQIKLNCIMENVVESAPPSNDQEKLDKPPIDEEKVALPPIDEDKVASPPIDEDKVASPPIDEDKVAPNNQLLDRDLAILMAERELTFLNKINELQRQVNINRLIMMVITIFQAISILYILKQPYNVDKSS